MSPLPRFHHFVAQSHTPRISSVRFVFGVAAASRNTRFQAARYGLTWAGLAPADRASFAWRLPSLDHLVGGHKQARRHGRAEYRRGVVREGLLVKSQGYLPEERADERSRQASITLPSLLQVEKKGSSRLRSSH
jgi:hypothetical protein